MPDDAPILTVAVGPDRSVTIDTPGQPPDGPRLREAVALAIAGLVQALQTVYRSAGLTDDGAHHAAQAALDLAGRMLHTPAALQGGRIEVRTDADRTPDA